MDNQINPGSNLNIDYHREFMKTALQEARVAFQAGEVPIGAVIAIGSEVVAKAHNMKEQWKDATAHAEMVVLNNAVKALGHWRYLKDAVLYVTLEPCPMCAGAIIQSRLARVVYGAADPKAGAVNSLMNLLQDPRLNHRVDVIAGVMEEECSNIMKEFFAGLRK